MDIFIMMAFMIGIGAVIGGVTNLIAIKMLFRPFNTLYIGKFRVPFTPGLIPKRRHQLAVQLGETVTTHLLTAEGVKGKISDPIFAQELTDWTSEEVRRFLKSDKSVSQWLEQQFDIQNAEQMLKEKAEDWIKNKLEDILSGWRGEKLHDLLPAEWNAKAEEKLPELSRLILQKAEDYLESTQGRAALAKGVDAFLMDKGTLVNMVSMFFGNISIAEKIRPELLKFIRQPQTEQTVNELLKKEWQNIKQKKWSELEASFDPSGTMKDEAAAIIVSQLPIGSFLSRPLKEWTSPVEQILTERMVPKAVALGMEMVSDRLELLLGKMNLAKIVEEQVETFSLQRLEEIIISIAKSELKMITWLGALLGGLIGVVQGLVVLFL
ncbi:DUF445 domain-containing protein [Fictibacillus aquaticus]|uniref:DUF445 domain-containing protein n=1 Tax=Fictibacillus aquaticus TaxID=2021314 RepID=A0A235F6H1_9BACL|nr:DUF445 family protein [Fictibacillus aquaticus]OYD56852.1 hypothetical protein CGZ90_14960 [Fictibacillus aquaticus]